MPLSKRAKARRRKQREADDVRLETLADWLEEYMPASVIDRTRAEHTTGSQRSQDAWELACDLMPVITRAWQVPPPPRVPAQPEETTHEGE